MELVSGRKHRQRIIRDDLDDEMTLVLTLPTIAIKDSLL